MKLKLLILAALCLVPAILLEAKDVMVVFINIANQDVRLKSPNKDNLKDGVIIKSNCFIEVSMSENSSGNYFDSIRLNSASSDLSWAVEINTEDINNSIRDSFKNNSIPVVQIYKNGHWSARPANLFSQQRWQNDKRNKFKNCPR